MARFVKHTQCPKCAEAGKDRKGNNLGVYDDGTSYCFSCGYVGSSSDRSFSYSGVYHNRHQRRGFCGASNHCLPDDIITVYPSVCIDWIKSYGLSVEDLYANRCVWSELYSRLIFPYYSSTNHSLLGWQGRYFGEENKSKWFSRGDLNSIHHVFNQGTEKHFLILVEDVVSGIKLGKIQLPVMPIFGSHISSKMIERLKLHTNKIVIWLDPDKRKESIEFAHNSNVLGLPATLVFSNKDPKEESYEDIAIYVSDAVNGVSTFN